MRMLGAWARPWCPRCRAPAGEDCPQRTKRKGARRALEKRQWLREAQAPEGPAKPGQDT